MGHRPPGVRPQAADRPPRQASARCASWAASAASRGAPRARTTCSTAATPAPASRSRRAWRSPATQRGTNERIAVVVGDAALMSGMSLEALNDIGQRRTRMLIVLNDNEMSISPTVGAMSQLPSRASSCRARGAARKRVYDDAVERIPFIGPAASSGRAGCASRSSTSPSPGSCSRTWASPTSGPCRATTCARWTPSPPRAARHGRPGDRPRPHPEGPRLPAGRDGPGQLPRRGAAAHDGRARGSRQRRAVSAVGQRRRRRRDAVDGAGRRGTRPKPPNYTAVMADELIALAKDDHASWPSRRACPRARAWPSSRPRSRTACTTSASPSSTR